MRLAALLLSIAALIVSARLSPANTSATEGTCKGILPLYQDGAANEIQNSRLVFIQTMHDIPIAFARSDNACLGPIPIYNAPILHWGRSEPNTHAMARRLAPLLAQYSKGTGLEACARMCQTSRGDIVTRIVTLRSHVVCMAPENTCPGESIATKETIHSHPPHRAFVANAVDALGWNDPLIENRALFTGYPNSLSPQDRDMAPLWLVGTEGQLIYLDTPDGVEVERP